MSDLKSDKSIINNKLKLYSMEDLDINKFEIVLKEINLNGNKEILEENVNVNSYLIKEKLEVSLYKFSSDPFVDYVSHTIYNVKINHFLSKYNNTNILKVYGILSNNLEKNHYIVYDTFDFTLEDYLHHVYNFAINKNIPKLTMNNKKNILLQLIQSVHSCHLLGYDFNINIADILFIKNNTTHEYNIKVRFAPYSDIEFVGLDINPKRNDELLSINEKWIINNNFLKNKFNMGNITQIAQLFIILLDDSPIILNRLSMGKFSEYAVDFSFLDSIKKEDNNFMVMEIIVNEIIVEKYGNEGLDLLKNMFEEDAKVKFNTKHILEHQFWKTNLKGGSNHDKFINSIKNNFKFIDNCDSCSSIPISSEIYKKKILESTYFEEIHANYKDVSFKEDDISEEMRIHLYKIFENVFKYVNLNNVESIDNFLIKQLDAFINASIYIRMFVNLKQNMEISVMLFFGLWTIFSNQYQIYNSIFKNYFMDYYKLEKWEDSIKYIEIFNNNIDIELLLNIEFIPITTHLNYIITKLSYESNEQLVSEKLNIDLVPVYLNLCQYYTSIPYKSMDYFTVYEICVLMIISTPLFFNNFNDYSTVDKFIENPPFEFLKLDLMNSRKFIARYMKAKKTLFKLPSSDSNSDLIVDYDFIHLTNSLSGDKIYMNNESKIEKIVKRTNDSINKKQMSNNSLNKEVITKKEVSTECTSLLYNDCKEWGNGCRWTGSEDIGKCNSKDFKITNELKCELKNENDCKSLKDGLFCYWEKDQTEQGKCLDKGQSIKYCSKKKNKKDCANSCKWTGSQETGVCLTPDEFKIKTNDEICSYKNKEDCNSLINGKGCNWLNDTKKCVSEEHNHCKSMSKKEFKNDCLKWFNGCKWIDDPETEGTCFLKKDLEICQNIKNEDCNTTDCHIKYDKCVPSNYE